MDNSYDNLKYLTGRLLLGADHLALEPLFKSKSDEELAQIFRNHETDPIGITDPNEVALRRHMDSWLNEASLIYLSWLSAYSSDPEGTDQGNRIFAILGHASLRPYYDSYYKQALSSVSTSKKTRLKDKTPPVLSKPSQTFTSDSATIAS
ncbi:MAG: hypothetical protein NTW74_04870 [Acidobacteria bacterium]|nr:hypothetical protein [Acidobacteriota bacterium]